jgi:5-methylcytosine-specific restriction endonuclease McrA
MPTGVYERTEFHRNAIKDGMGHESVRKHMSIAHKGQKVAWKGKKLPERSGENSPVWKGGLCENKKYYHKYKRAIKKYTGELSPKIVQLVYEDNIKKYGTLTCYLCEKPTMFGKDCLEHVIPRRLNGTNNYDNLRVSCNICNLKKHSKTLEQYRKEQDV